MLHLVVTQVVQGVAVLDEFVGVVGQCELQTHREYDGGDVLRLGADCYCIRARLADDIPVLQHCLARNDCLAALGEVDVG